MQRSVSSVLRNIKAAGKALESGELGSRELLIQYSEELRAALEEPSETLQRIYWTGPALEALLRIAVEIKLFQHLKDAGETGITPEDLAKRTGANVLLMQRFMRHLIATNVVTFFDGKIVGTRLSHEFAAENNQQSIRFCYDVAGPAFRGFPDFFKQTRYNNPTSLSGPFQAAHATKLPFFEWLITKPSDLADFDAFMSAYRAGKADWHDAGFYPVAERLVEGFRSRESEVFLVDVGGGRGHDLESFAKHENGALHHGGLVLQDREQVIGGIQNRDKLPFRCEAHDFFTPQPIQGARAYLLHSILHDWDDEKAVEILENLRSALKPGYSRVLLNEIVLSEEHPTIAATSMDMMMLAHFAVRERTEMDWKTILVKAGLKLLRIYSFPGVAESVIEAELPGPPH